jgi:lambda repressor-like predicted transcriptional regulator
LVVDVLASIQYSCIATTTKHEGKGMVLAHIELRTDKLTDLRRVAGLESDAELARRIGIHQSSLIRVLTDQSKPGIPFVAGLLDVFGGAHWFERLFTIAQDTK